MSDPLNKTFIRRWVDELRSKKHKQARGQLRKRNGAMCCLGVACHLQDSTRWKWDRGLGTNSGLGGYVWQFDQRDWQTEGLTLPTNLREELGLSWEDVDELERRNDGDPENGVKGASFAQIADYLEETYLAN